jgi:hypothetical protein
MKKYFCIIFCLITQASIAQEIPIQELITFHSNGLEKIEEYVKSHNWNYLSFSPAPKEGGVNLIEWSFGKNGSFDKNGNPTALGWLKFYYSDNPPNSVDYQYSDENYYKKTVASLKTLGFKLEKIIPSEKMIDKVFLSKNVAVTISEYISENGRSTYVYGVMDRNIYILVQSLIDK